MPRILVVDDEPPNVELLTIALGRKGFGVIGAYTGCDGLSLARAEMPDAIILDMLLPDIGAEEFCRQLRKTPEIAHLPIIVLTALQGTSTEVQGVIEAGANCFKTKPANFTELAAQLHHLIALDNNLAMRSA